MCAGFIGNLAGFGILAVKEKAYHLADILSHFLHLRSGRRISLHILVFHDFLIKSGILLLQILDFGTVGIFALACLLLIFKR